MKHGRRVRIAVAGTGSISQVVHLPILTERYDVDVVAVSDPDDLKATTIGKRFGVERILTDEELIAEESIDAVVICAPGHRHEELAVQVLKAGKHVLVERPLALSADGVSRVLDSANESGAKAVVGMAHRYRADVSALRAFVAGGELGEISALHVSWLNRRVRHARASWRQGEAYVGGGALMDLGVPALDLALWVLGYPEVSQVGARTYGDGPSEEEAHLTAITSSGTMVFLSASARYHGSDDVHEMRVLGSEGAALVPPMSVYKQLGGRPLDVTPRQPIPRGGEDLFINAYRRQLDHFIRVVGAEAEARPPVEQRGLMDLIEGAYRSAREGREITLS